LDWRLPQLTMGMIGLDFEIATASAASRSSVLRGYPVPTIKKKRACVVTYRHSGEELFENCSSPYSTVTDL
jgi:hypothetical protein